MICRILRKRKKAKRRMQEENTPFVGNQHVAPAGAQSNDRDQRGIYQQTQQNAAPYVYDGPLELQGSGKPEPVHIDGYTAAVRL
jgi:hypothetical protein